MDSLLNNSALFVVDMQRYYLDSTSSYSKYFLAMDSDLSYIKTRCQDIVIPNIKKILTFVRKYQSSNCICSKIIYLRLCGTRADRQDLHKHFEQTNRVAMLDGFEGVYPLASEPMADILPEIAPMSTDIVVNKTCYSPFTKTNIDEILKENKIKTIFMTGLSSSQCVETTARDASDRNYNVVFIEDAMADFSQMHHEMALINSCGVCGGNIMQTSDFCSTNIL